ncbi:MAG: hypothetical protein ACTS73_05995 [Arsenophonus sp. NEOnobi-MAG3]
MLSLQYPINRLKQQWLEEHRHGLHDLSDIRYVYFWGYAIYLSSVRQDDRLFMLIIYWRR